VARKKSLFDDKSGDIQQLTLIIKQDIGTLNRQIGQLQEVRSWCSVIHSPIYPIMHSIATVAVVCCRLLISLMCAEKWSMFAILKVRYCSQYYQETNTNCNPISYVTCTVLAGT